MATSAQRDAWIAETHNWAGQTHAWAAETHQWSGSDHLQLQELVNRVINMEHKVNDILALLKKKP